MKCSYSGILVIIPTRNRSDLVRNAVRSLTAQPCGGKILVLLSDNSTDDAHVERNRLLVNSTKDLDISYIRPPHPLSMSDHWDWALRTALDTYKQSHVLFLTDRMVFKPQGLCALECAIRSNPNDIVTYNLERINDYATPVIYERSIATGKLYRIESQRVLQLASRMIIHPCFPRMLNCAVPAHFLTQLINLNGRAFDSISPDFNFCFMSLGQWTSFLFLDETILVHYGIDRSNGASFSRGAAIKDLNNFPRNFTTLHFPDAPIPALLTVTSAVAHEYIAAKSKLRSVTFPEIDISSYLSANRREIRGFINDQPKADSQLLIAAYQKQHAIPPDSLLVQILARARTLIHRVLTRKLDLRFNDQTQALLFLLKNRPKSRTLFDQIRLVPYRLFLKRLLHCSRQP